ncbi:BRO-N domain-containing protein [Pseudomonas matsuisoli]|uniref:Bro-N domain-containing protein n=1 Tax=Pseudomonas matsuisoli TaxID=1515666 RepID=A0A917PRH2_9PSED|nr:BRO family protein [Pseudomonas matsuisoli]GGJ88435.1 hypothetical protein GCM10009304_12680 [Pseudomonas matsuisoli]
MLEFGRCVHRALIEGKTKLFVYHSSDIVGRLEIIEVDSVMDMRFVKQSFLGIELDILVGHPEHDILFVATQVARAAGLKNPSHQVSRHAKIAGHRDALQAGSIQIVETWESPKGVQKTSWFFTEPATYQMLLRGHAPQSEPFRKWVTEEVLPSIRKTGTYDLFASETKEAQQFSGEFAQLHQALAELTTEVRSLKDIIAGLQMSSPVEPVKSPYEGTPGVAVCDPGGFDGGAWLQSPNGFASRTINALRAPLFR